MEENVIDFAQTNYSKEFAEDYKKLKEENKLIDDFFDNQIKNSSERKELDKRLKRLEEEVRKGKEEIRAKTEMQEILTNIEVFKQKSLKKADVLKSLKKGQFFEKHEKELFKDGNPYEKFLKYDGTGYVSPYEIEQLRKTINHFKIFLGVHVFDNPNTEYDDFQDYLVAEIFGRALDEWNDNPIKYSLSTIADVIMHNLAQNGTPLTNKHKCCDCIQYILEVRKENYQFVNKHLEETYYDNDYDDQYEYNELVKKKSDDNN